MPTFEGVSYAIGGTRGAAAGLCGPFHEFGPGPDHMCSCCRPAPDDSDIIRANKWLQERGISTKYGSKEWGEGLILWDQAGRP